MARYFSNDNPLRNTSFSIAMPFALVAWSKQASAGSDQVFISVGEAAAAQYYSLGINGTAAGDPVKAKAYDGGSNFAQTSSGITFNKWFHGCGVFVTATDRRAYIDGGSEGTNTTSRTPNAVGAVAVGASADSTPFGKYTGDVGEAAVYDLSVYPGATDALKADAFRDTTLQVLAAGYSPLLAPLGLVGYWDLIRDEKDRVGGYDLSTNVAVTVSAHPPVIYPSAKHISHLVAAAAGVEVEVPVGTLTLTGYAPTVVASDHQQVDVPLGTLTLTGYAPTVVASDHQQVDVPLATLTLTGYAPTISISDNINIDVPAGALTLTGYAPTVAATANVSIDVPLGALTLTGYVPTVVISDHQIIDVPLGTLTLTGYAPAISISGTSITTMPLGGLGGLSGLSAMCGGSDT